MADARLYISGMSGGSTNSFQDICARFAPGRFGRPRAVALLSAAITLSDPESLGKAIGLCRAQHLTRTQIYETILQSYLFLGFPRMLVAAERLQQELPIDNPTSPVAELDITTAPDWLERGQALCRRVYGDNYDALKSRVGAMAPEIFLWMEFEGYGKVLSRPGLDIIDREVGIVACLLVENRAMQLHSHLRGTINVGGETDLILEVIGDLRPLSEAGYQTAMTLLKKMGVVG